MADNRLPFRQRLANLIAPSSAKSLVPSLPPEDAGFGDVVGGLNDYKYKSDQVQANVGWVFTANTAIADPCAAVKLKLYRRMSNGDSEEIEQHDILHLMDAPNNAHTGEQLRQLHFTYMNLTGESYILMARGGSRFTPTKGQLPDALQILPSHGVDFDMKPRYSDSIVKYNNIEYPITSVIRDINPDPASPYNGRSVISAASASVDIDTMMKDWNRNLFANNARPGMLFSSNAELSDTAYARTVEMLKDNYSGTHNAYKPMLIEGGDAKPYMLNAQDLDFLAGREFSRDEILAMFRVPSAILGATTDFNRANMDAAFYIHTVINVVPRVRQFVRQLNAAFVQVYDPTLYLDFESPVPEDKEGKMAEAAAGLNKWWTIDEVREMYGMEALPDKLGTQIYVVNTTTTLKQAAQEIEAPAADGSATKPNAHSATGDDADDPDNDIQPEGKSLTGVKKNS